MRKLALGVVIALFTLAISPLAVQAKSASPTKKQASQKALKKTGKKTAKKTVSKRESAKRTKHALAKASVAKRAKSGKAAVTTASTPKSTVHRITYAPSPYAAGTVLTVGDMAGLHLTPDPLALKSNAALVIDQTNSEILFEKNSAIALPIASLTKLMMALVVVEARQDLNEVLEVTSDDIDREKNSSSRLRVGSQMTRADMLHIALMSSENRAASALGRHYPGGRAAFVAAMNAKAKLLGMTDTHFVDSTGLSSHNVASARDLAKLVDAAHRHTIIRKYSTYPRYEVNAGGYHLNYINSNRLVMSSDWEIGLQKTGYISEAGRCLVMQSMIEGRPVVMVFLDSKGKDSRLGDASRIRKWLETSKRAILTQAAASQS
ncbi:MAG TPA: D-alanyl-D-alanine endopeptidase [Noviherbaspirillum sp.]|nr:D-alanyl-D-alanine endopeptidase [Noviherbaspirillum sp.]